MFFSVAFAEFDGEGTRLSWLETRGLGRWSNLHQAKLKWESGENTEASRASSWLEQQFRTDLGLETAFLGAEGPFITYQGLHGLKAVGFLLYLLTPGTWK